jgi:transposase-like protein
MILAEYISGGISQRKLAQKYGVPVDTLIRKANREKWAQQRDEVHNKATTAIQRTTADKIVENTKVAADLKKKLLLRLQQIEAKYPFDATEIKTKQGDNVVIFRIKDLTAAYRDLTEDMNLNGSNDQVRIIIDV